MEEAQQISVPRPPLPHNWHSNPLPNLSRFSRDSESARSEASSFLGIEPASFTANTIAVARTSVLGASAHCAMQYSCIVAQI
jgi:hypothetical protein